MSTLLRRTTRAGEVLEVRLGALTLDQVRGIYDCLGRMAEQAERHALAETDTYDKGVWWGRMGAFLDAQMLLDQNYRGRDRRWRDGDGV